MRTTCGHGFDVGWEIPEELYQAIVEIYAHFSLSTQRTPEKFRRERNKQTGTSPQEGEKDMRHQYLMIDSRGNPVAHRNIWMTGWKSRSGRSRVDSGGYQAGAVP